MFSIISTLHQELQREFSRSFDYVATFLTTVDIKVCATERKAFELEDISQLISQQEQRCRYRQQCPRWNTLLGVNVQCPSWATRQSQSGFLIGLAKGLQLHWQIHKEYTTLLLPSHQQIQEKEEETEGARYPRLYDPLCQNHRDTQHTNFWSEIREEADTNFFYIFVVGVQESGDTISKVCLKFECSHF